MYFHCDFHHPGRSYPGRIFYHPGSRFDFIDGMAARLLNQISEFGKQLDSLADVVSFGVAPAMILYRSDPYRLSVRVPVRVLMCCIRIRLEALLLYSPLSGGCVFRFKAGKIQSRPETGEKFQGTAHSGQCPVYYCPWFYSESGIRIMQGIPGLSTAGFFLVTIVFIMLFAGFQPPHVFP